MMEGELYTINGIIGDAGIIRPTFDKFAEASNLHPVKTEEWGKKLYSLKGKEFVASHYISGKGKEEKERLTNYKAKQYDEVIDLLREQVQQPKRANEQLVHDNDVLTDQLKVKDNRIAAVHQLTDQAQKLHLGLEKQVKALIGNADKSVVDSESSDANSSNSQQKSTDRPMSTKRATRKSRWHTF